MASSLADLLRRSVETMHLEVPGGPDRVAEVLRPLTVMIRADDETFGVTAGDELEVTDADPRRDAEVQVATTRQAILRVIDAELTLAEAIEAGQLFVLGSLDSVAQAHDALMAYANAALRSRSLGALVDELRAGTAPDPVRS